MLCEMLKKRYQKIKDWKRAETHFPKKLAFYRQSIPNIKQVFQTTSSSVTEDIGFPTQTVHTVPL